MDTKGTLLKNEKLPVPNKTAEEAERKLIIDSYKELLKDCYDFTRPEDREQIRKAFDFSRSAHRYARRASGEPYILHPIAVARITATEIGLRDKFSIIAALLHDVVEDTRHTLEDIERLFGATVAKIVDGLTKISAVSATKAIKEAESLRKLLLIMSDDVRVALIKIADRLHNMRTLTHMKMEKQVRIAAETASIYAPLAHRLGLYNIKTELEDLSLKYTQPKIYHEIENKLLASQRKREIYIQSLIDPLKALMDEIQIPATIVGRVKSINSIYEKMQRQGVTFEEVFDVFAVRIIINVEDVSQEDERDLCWKVYSRIAERYRTHDHRLRDWISKPRMNGYESLHATLMDPRGKWVEVQIRTRRMDYVAEKGMAAHWKYKQGATASEEAFETWLNKIRDLIENNQIQSEEFLNNVKSDIVSEQIHVFTPNGDLKLLPRGSTALDFAYEIHTDVGNHCIGAKVNHQLTPFSHVLVNGDQVEIITSQKQKPLIQWTDYVVTPKAKKKIQEATRRERMEAREKGKKIFDWRLKSLNMERNHRYVQELIEEFKVDSLDEFYVLLGTKRLDIEKLADFIRLRRNNIDPEDVIDEINDEAHIEEVLQKTRGVTTDALFAGDALDAASKLAECCFPIPGDEVIGVLVAENEICVHRMGCPELEKIIAQPENKLIKLKWRPELNSLDYLTGVRIRGGDRKGILNDLVKVITLQMNIYIRSITIDTYGGFFDGVIKLYVRNTSELDKLINDIKEVTGVLSVLRTN